MIVHPALKVWKTVMVVNKVGAVTGVEAVLSRFVRPVGVSLSAESLGECVVALFVPDAVDVDIDVEVVDSAGPVGELVEAAESGKVTSGVLCFCGKLVVVTVNIDGSVSTTIPVDLVRVTKEVVVWMCSSTQPTSPSLSSSKAGLLARRVIKHPRTHSTIMDSFSFEPFLQNSEAPQAGGDLTMPGLDQDASTISSTDSPMIQTGSTPIQPGLNPAAPCFDFSTPAVDVFSPETLLPNQLSFQVMQTSNEDLKWILQGMALRLDALEQAVSQGNDRMGQVASGLSDLRASLKELFKSFVSHLVGDDVVDPSHEA
ncbi:WD40 repeat-like-containing domain [Purpureocillium lavendulum]|uniref:WD40 repeat-like-containing domain n=1 Tax=Purpureocillium lavendulum TaxID=1247861 RepID=A0AB34G1D6_9HYPO|nr:WD40 repeat-like-containing domain [Purpureocillium lavendulum]